MAKNSKPVSFEGKDPRTHCSGTKGYTIAVRQKVVYRLDVCRDNRFSIVKGKVTPSQARLWPRDGQRYSSTLRRPQRQKGVSGQQHFTAWKDPLPIVQEAGWAPGPVWTGGKSRPHRDSIPGPSSPQSVAIPTELPGPRFSILSTYFWHVIIYFTFHFRGFNLLKFFSTFKGFGLGNNQFLFGQPV